MFHLVSKQPHEKGNVLIFRGKKTGGFFTFVSPSLRIMSSDAMCLVVVGEHQAEVEI